jgi:type IV secretion system protein VirD4
MLHWKYSKEQIAELKRAVAIKMPTEDILEFFYPEASTQQMREIVDTFYVLKQVYNNS